MNNQNSHYTKTKTLFLFLFAFITLNFANIRSFGNQPSRTTKLVYIKQNKNKFGEEKIYAGLKTIPIENLIFEGGSVNGIVHIGVVEALHEYNQFESVKNIVGSSSGSIAAVIYALGHSHKVAKSIIYNMRFNDKMDIKSIKRDKSQKILLDNFSNIKSILQSASFGKTYNPKGIYIGNEMQSDINNAIKSRLKDGAILASLEVATIAEKCHNDLEGCYKKAEAFFMEQTFPKNNLSTVEEGLKVFMNNRFNYNRVMSVSNLLNVKENESLIQKLQLRAQKMHELSNKLEDITFEDLHEASELMPELEIKNIVIIGLNYTKGEWQIFSKDNTKNHSIAMAVRISVALPTVFCGVNDKENMLINAGLLGNYLGRDFDAIEDLENILVKTADGINLLTLRLTTDYENNAKAELLRQITTKKDKSLSVKVQSLIKKSLSQKSNVERTVVVQGVQSGSFVSNLTETEKDELTKKGYKATVKWLKNYQLEALIRVEISSMEDVAQYLSAEDYRAEEEKYSELFGVKITNINEDEEKERSVQVNL